MLRRAAVRRNPSRQTIARSKTIAAPVEGWDASSALANMKEIRAVQLKNWFPRPDSVEVRRGYRYHAWDLGSGAKTVSSIDDATDVLSSTAHGLANGDRVKINASTTMPGGVSATRVYYVVNANTDDFQISTTEGGSALDISSAGSGTITVFKVSSPIVETLAVWQGPSSSKMFAAAGGAFWDVTSNAAATFAHGGAFGVNRWQTCMHTTSAGHFLFCVNGTDAPQHYNGSTWAAPTITGTGITPGDFVGVVSHKKRLIFTIANSTAIAYLPVEAVAGTAALFQVGSQFTRGGYVLACSTWTRDGGAGADDYLVVVSSRGQIALYQGTDISDATKWAIVGVFDVPTPIGRRCFARFGGDVLLITLEGVFPLSQLLSVDQSQSDRVAISERISNAFNTAAKAYGSNWGWEICVYPRGTRLLVNIPTTESTAAVQYGMNTLTGAWFEQDNHNALCWAVYNDNLYFAGAAGDVYRADTGRADVDTPVVATGQTAYSAYGTPNLKRFAMLRPLVTTTGTNRPSIGMSVDFVETSNLSTPSTENVASGAAWDSATWDASVWGGEDQVITDWSNLVALGTFGSIKFRATTGANSGGSLWGVSLWGTDLWGSQGQSDETMRVQGFLVLHEPGGYI